MLFEYIIIMALIVMYSDKKDNLDYGSIAAITYHLNSLITRALRKCSPPLTRRWLFGDRYLTKNSPNHQLNIAVVQLPNNTRITQLSAKRNKIILNQIELGQAMRCNAI